MGKFFNFGVDKETEEFEGTEDLERTETGTRTETTVGERVQTEEELQQERESEVVTQLPQDVQDAIQALILDLTGFDPSGAPGDQLAGTRAGDRVEDISQILFERAQTAEADIGEQTQAIIDAQRETGENQIQALFSNLATTAGSSLNTAVAAGTSRASSELNTQLGRVSAEAALAGREAATNEFTAALQGFGASAETGARESSGITDLVNALRGGTTSTTREAETTGSSRAEESASETLTAILNSFVTQKTVKEGTTEKGGFDLGFGF